MYKNYKKPRTPKVIEITCARPQDENTLKAIKDKFGDNLEIKVNVDESLIGGAKIFFNNKIFDFSVSHFLEELKIKLTS